jgi:chromosome segregation ATPase
MEVLKQLESKIHALVTSRNELLEDSRRTHEQLQEYQIEIQRLRDELDRALSKSAALDAERSEVMLQVETILDQLIRQLEAQGDR